MNEDRTRWEKRHAAHGADRGHAPSAFLQQHIAHIERGPALDIACGTGRHALYLARHGFPVDAIDIAAAGLRRTQQSARAERLPVRLVQADLDQFPLARDHYALVTNVRYLNRALFQRLKDCVRPSGCVLFETFTVDQAAIGHPSNPAYLLASGELRSAFSDFEILAYEEGLFETEIGPAYLARLLARHPAGRRRSLGVV
jgi:tellurite methyltransferase